MKLGEQIAAKGQELPLVEETTDELPPDSEPIEGEDPFNGEDPDEINRRCQQRIEDTLAQKVKDRQRTLEAYQFHDANEYDLTGVSSTLSQSDTRLYFKASKSLVTAIIAQLTENGFDIRIKADPSPRIQHPAWEQITAQYVEQFGLPQGAHGEAVGELLTHGESTINEKVHLPRLIQQWTEYALVDGPGCAYSYTGVSRFSPDVVIKQRVPSDQVWIDQTVDDFYEKEWMCRFWPVTLEKLIARWPEEEEFFRENLNAGQKVGQQDKKKSQLFSPDFLEEHWFRNWELIEGPDGVKTSKYPGNWMQVWRYGDRVLTVQPNQHLHQDCPYDQLLGVTKMDSPQGLSFVLDLLYGPIMAENRLLNAAIETAERSGKGKRLILADALENPEDATDDSLSTLLVRPGFNLQECVYNLTGGEIGPSIQTALAMLQAKFPQIVGSAPNPGTVSPEASDAAKSGWSNAPFRARLREFLARIAKKDIANLIQFEDKERSFHTMGGYGPAVVRYIPNMFLPVIDNLESYYTIEVTDKKPTLTDPVKQAEIQREMIKLAREAQEANPGMSYSQALETTPPFEDRDRMIRQARINEAEQRRKAQEAAAKGLPDPTQQMVAAKNKASRGEDLSESAKRNLQDLSGKYPEAVFILNATGGGNKYFQIAQEEQQPLTKEQAEQVLRDLGMAVPTALPGMSPGTPGNVAPVQATPTGPQAPGAMQ